MGENLYGKLGPGWVAPGLSFDEVPVVVETPVKEEAPPPPPPKVVEKPKVVQKVVPKVEELKEDEE